MDNPSVHKGYDARNIAVLDDRYKCLICRLLFRNPVQFACGHRVCRLHLPRDDSVFNCPECSKPTLITEIRLDKGLINDMQKIVIQCNLCDWFVSMKAYEHHLEESHKQYRCSLCDETFDSPTVLDQHIQLVCPKVTVTCNFELYGCKKQFLRRNLAQHNRSEEHQHSLVLFILQLIANKILKSSELPEIEVPVEQEMADLSYKGTTTTSTPLTTDEQQIQTECLRETTDTFTSGIEVLGDELQQINEESLQQSQKIETTKQTLSKLQTSNEESVANLDALHCNLMLLQQCCSSLKQTFEDRQYTSYDGTLIWKITNVREKMVDAQSERQTSIYSAPFYSSSSGYKMCVRLYLYGDGNARRTHMSLFFVLMRGLNDSLLTFPFRYKVTFCLFDQSDQKQHIVDSFRPDTRSNSFQRPRCHMNIASGIPKFVLLSTVQQSDNPYVVADTMFIKVMVDFGNLDKAILPYAMSLNPALPTEYQQRMIQEELERPTLSKTLVSSYQGPGNIDGSSRNQQQITRDNTMKK